MRIVTDYSEVRDQFKPLPRGNHRVNVTDCELVEGQNGKSDQLKLVMSGLDYPYADHGVVDYIPLMDSLIWKFNMLFKAARVQEGYEFDLTVIEDIELLKKHPMIVSVVMESYEKDGQTLERSKVKGYYPADKSNKRESDPLNSKSNGKEEDDVPF